jgi:hypothetical protein
MAKPRRTIPFHILLRLAPRAVALLWKVITARRVPIPAPAVARPEPSGAPPNARRRAPTPHLAQQTAPEERRAVVSDAASGPALGRPHLDPDREQLSAAAE